MAATYMSNKRQASSNAHMGKLTTNARFKNSTATLSRTQNGTKNVAAAARNRSTSMTNLSAANTASSDPNNNNNSLILPSQRLQRPASRSALDSIHNGMNAKYAQVQSKVLMNNIRPSARATSPQQQQQQRRAHSPMSPSGPRTNRAAALRTAPAQGRQGARSPGPGGQQSAAGERSQMINKLKTQQEQLERQEHELGTLKHELEREKSEKLEQVQQIKQELQDKLVEHERQNEEYHQKLLEAYELADQNRRAADSVIAEARQREEEQRKKIDELEAQLGELKEFVAMKEEMTGKMFELREQIRTERERYEEQLKSLHQVFENEKLR